MSLANERVPIAGVPVDNVDMNGAIARIEELISSGTGAYVVTPNVDHIVRLQHDHEFMEVYRHADLVVADGMPLIWASRYLGTPLVARVTGADLFPKLCHVAGSRGYRIFLFGALPGAAETAAQKLIDSDPRIVVAGTYCPPYGFEHDEVENKNCIDRIRRARPDILFVGLGAPKQEKWIYRHRDELGVPVSVGVGAAIDFMAGFVRRAPRFVQNAGIEWLWRIMMEPRRLWRRYLVDDPVFFYYVWKQKRAFPRQHANN